MCASCKSLCDAYLTHTKDDQATKTLADRKLVLANFCVSYGDRDAETMRAADLIFWITSNKQWKSAWTKRRVMSTVARVFNWGKKLGLIEKAPFQGLSHPAGAAGRPMTDAEFVRLSRSVNGQMRRVLYFLRWTGARPCEMAALRWEHVNLERGVAILRHHKTARHGKPRIIFMPPVCVRLLRWIRNYIGPKQPFVFTNRLGNQWTTNALGIRLFRLRDRVGLDKSARLYGLRHQFATDFLLHDGELKTLAEILGHTTTRMTEHYVHLAGRVDFIQAALAKVFERNKKG